MSKTPKQIVPVVGGVYQFPDGQPCKVIKIEGDRLSVVCDGRAYQARTSMLTQIEIKKNETANI